MPFNALTNAEAERLAILAEECGELVQAIGKILRHGYERRSPFEQEGRTNRADLAREMGDVLGVIDFLVQHDDTPRKTVQFFREVRLGRMKPYLHHQEADHAAD